MFDRERALCSISRRNGASELYVPLRLHTFGGLLIWVCQRKMARPGRRSVSRRTEDQHREFHRNEYFADSGHEIAECSLPSSAGRTRCRRFDKEVNFVPH